MSSSVLRNVIHPKTSPNGSKGEPEAADVTDYPSDDLEGVLGVLVENAPVCMAMFDRHMRYLLANRRWVEEFGLQAIQPLIGRSQYEVFPGLHPGWRQVYERSLQGHVVRSEHDSLSGPGGQRIVYRWEVRPWRRRRDASVGGLMVTCEKFSGITPAEASSAAEADAAAEERESKRKPDLSGCVIPVMQIDEHGVIHYANDAAVDLCLARGIQEGVSTFWDVVVDGHDIHALRQQTMAAMEKLAAAGAPKSVELQVAGGSHNGSGASVPQHWLFTPVTQTGPVKRFVALALPKPASDQSSAAAVAGLPALAHAVASIAQSTGVDAIAANLEVRRLQDDLSRARQELRTLHEAERTFVQREGRIRQYLEVLPCGILVLDELGTPIFQNEQLTRLLGRAINKDETVEQWLAAACPNEDHCREVAAVWRDDVWRRQLTRTFSLATADGLLKELEFHPVALPKGGLLISIQDATESCRHEEQLRATEAKFRTLLHEAPIPIVLMDKVGAVFEVNHLAEELFGHSKSELRRYPLDAWLEPESGHDRREAVRQLTAAGRRGASLDVQIRKAEGAASSPARLHVAPVLDAGGEPHSTVHFFQTQAPHEAEGEALLTVDQVAVADKQTDALQPTPGADAVTLVKTNVHGRVREWTERAEALFGVAAERAESTPLHQYFRPSDATGFYAELARMAEEPEAWHEISYYDAQRQRQTQRMKVIARGGGGHDFELLEYVEAPPVEAATPAPEPISEADDEKETGWAAPNLSREKLLLSETHHRIKNHLQIISSLLNLECNTLADEAGRKALISSQNRIRSIADLHQHLYEVASGTAASFADFAAGLVSRLRQCYEVPAERVAVSLELETGPIQQEWLMPLALTLNETLSNCFEHAFPEGRPGEVRVRLSFDPSAGCLQVSDNGVGLPEGFKTEAAEGLGLKILAVFSEQMRGQFQIRGAESEGTEIQLRFPIAFIDN